MFLLGKIFADAYFALSYSYLESFSSIIDVFRLDRLTEPGLTEAYNNIKGLAKGTRALSGATPKTAAADAGTLVNPEALAGAAAASAVALELVLTVFAGLEIVAIGQAALCIRSMQLVCADYEKYDAAVAAREATAAELEGIAKRYGYGECNTAANAMAEYLTKNGQKFLYVEFMFTGPFENNKGTGVVRTITGGGVFPPGGEISTSGYHIGIRYGGRVFCNVHPTGLPIEPWFADFVGDGVQMRNYGTPVPMGPVLLLPQYLRP